MKSNDILIINNIKKHIVGLYDGASFDNIKYINKGENVYVFKLLGQKKIIKIGINDVQKYLLKNEYNILQHSLLCMPEVYKKIEDDKYLIIEEELIDGEIENNIKLDDLIDLVIDVSCVVSEKDGFYLNKYCENKINNLGINNFNKEELSYINKIKNRIYCRDKFVLCNYEITPDNIIINNDGIYIVDWGYSGYNIIESVYAKLILEIASGQHNKKFTEYHSKDFKEIIEYCLKKIIDLDIEKIYEFLRMELIFERVWFEKIGRLKSDKELQWCEKLMHILTK